MVQWDKEECADLGIVKVDLLGLGMMAALEDSITLIRDHYKEDVDLASCRPTTCRLRHIAKGRHVWHVPDRKSRADVVPPRLHPTRFYDIVVQVVIFDPGPSWERW